MLSAIRRVSQLQGRSLGLTSSMLLRSASTAKPPTIVYTLTDEAPYLATYSLLPILKRFTTPNGINIASSDISLATRILSAFDLAPDNLGQLGKLAKQPDGYIIKLPNVSASIPQLNEAIAELQKQGFKVPNYPQEPKTEEEKAIKAKYAKVLGSAVNPVLREGNSDRRAAKPVKQYAQKNPHKLTAWSKDNKSHVATMAGGDFFASEQSYVTPTATSVRIELVPAAGGAPVVLKKETKLLPGEVIDASFMSARQLREFYEKEFTDAKKNNVMVSLHLKATMMKISDPILFGHAVSVFYKEAFEKNADVLKKLAVNPNNGLGAVLDKVKTLPEPQRAKVLADFDAVYNSRPRVAMVDSKNGITNFHVPSDVIIDASMPPMVRDGGKMWNKDNKLEDTKCIIPDRCYSGVYSTIVNFVKSTGQFNVATMGHVSNVGLMAQAAEEYGSHDKTFEIPQAGTVNVIEASSGKTLLSHKVEAGDVWRMCQTKDIPIKDWVRLAVDRARQSNTPAIFWLNKNRAHDAKLIEKVNTYLKEFDTKGLDISIKTPDEACLISMQRAKEGKDTISVTGNVLRDYNTDMFPILELGTSAKMLSIVPLLAGGGMYETGAGGSAPKHVDQFLEENHLRWDSLGEYLAMAVALEDLGNKTKNPNAVTLGKTLNAAIGQLLDKNKSPSRKANQIDNRGSNFYLSLFWAQELAKVDKRFAPLADALSTNEKTIAQDLIACQGKPLNIGGYYHPDEKLTTAAMRPSKVFNQLIDDVPSS